MLTVGRSAYSGEVMAVNNTLKAATFGSTDNVNVLDIILDDVRHGDGVSKLELTLEVCRKLDSLRLGVVPAFLKWPIRGALACISLISS